jgi:uncharacterized protein YegL
MVNEIKIDGLDNIEVENTAIDSLETEEINLMLLAIDVSGSMCGYVSAMEAELSKFKSSIINSKESEKILVCRADFSSQAIFKGYKKIEEFDIDYSTEDSTCLYDVIVEGAKKLLDYMNYLRQQGMRVKAVFAVFSDGQDTCSKNILSTALKTVQELNKLEVVTAFISFGQDAELNGKDLDFKNVLKVGQSESELRKAFNRLSKSLVSQSKSVLPKKDDFFEM